MWQNHGLHSPKSPDGRQLRQPGTPQPVPGLAGVHLVPEGPARHLVLLLLLAPLALWLGADGVERSIMIGSMMLVLVVEVLNSAVEAVVDRWGVEHHELAGRAKDMGSAAVFLADLNVLACWGLILGPRYL